MANTKPNIFKPSLLTIALVAAGMSIGIVTAAERNIHNINKPITTSEHYAVLQTEDAAVSEDVNQQTADQPEIKEETLIITGYRGSLVRSLEEKRNADTISEQLSSDDLGSLPDISIADALTRLPGISAVRTGGQAAEINIRGLSGGFILATLNGREQTSTSGTRSVEFDQYPSELISSGAVYKSQKASLIEGGVAATVDLKTASALSNTKQHTFTFNVRGMFNDRADEVFDADSDGNRISFSYQGKFLDETLGFSVGFARLDQPSVATQFVGLNYNTSLDFEPDGIPDIFFSEGFEMQHKGGTEIRNGYVATVEWVPGNTFVLKADAFISKFESEQFARGLRVKFGGSTANYYNPVVDQNSVIGANVVRTGQSFTRVELVNDDDTKIDEIKNYGVNAKWELTDQFVLTADVSYSVAESDFQNRLLWSLVAEDATLPNPVFDTDVQINYRLNGLNLPNVGFNQSFTNINQVMASKYGTYPFVYRDDLKAFKLDGVYEILDNDWVRSIEVGYRYSERNYNKNRSLYEYGNDGGFSLTEGPFQLNNTLATPVNFTGEFSHFPGYLAIDIDSVLGAWLPAGAGNPVQTWGVDSSGVIDNHSAWSVLQSGEVFEDVTSFYVQANIDGIIDDLPITGNIGLRAVHTEQYATTIQNVDGDILRGAQNIIDEVGLVNSQYARGIDGISYTDYLPSLNLNFKITDDSQIRFAASRVMSRAPIQKLSAEVSGQVDLGTHEFNATSVNSPALKPFLANQYDLSYEYYFNDSDGAFIAAAFLKDIKSFIDDFTDLEFDFSTTNIDVPETFEDPLSGIPFTVLNGSFTRAVNNTNGGYIRGVELAYQQTFSMLPDPFAGLGVNISYAYTESEVEKITSFGGTTVDLPLDGLSTHVISATLYYEYEDFETRINARSRSRFVSEQIAVNEQTVYFDGETVLDYQASYAFSEDGTVLFQVNNLTDQPTKSYFGSTQQTGTIQFFGRQFFLGVAYKL